MGVPEEKTRWAYHDLEATVTRLVELGETPNAITSWVLSILGKRGVMVELYPKDEEVK